MQNAELTAERQEANETYEMISLRKGCQAGRCFRERHEGDIDGG